MKTVTHLRRLLPLFPLALASSLNAQLFLADTRTVATDGGSLNTSSGATRLFTGTSEAPGTAAPLGTTIWFVADTGRNGILPNQPTPGSLFGADDVVLYRDALDGDNPGSTTGRYRRLGIEVQPPSSGSEDLYRNSDIWVVLWNGTGATYTPAAGSTFGAYNTGTFTVPQIGNGWWAIDGNVYNGQFTVVPEPATTAAIATVGLAGFALWRRRQHKRG
jgi:hypothetical protein